MRMCQYKTTPLPNLQCHHSPKQRAALVLRIAYKLCKTAHPSGTSDLGKLSNLRAIETHFFEASEYLRCRFAS